MDAQIKQVVTNDVKPVEMIIKSKGEIEDKTARQIIPDSLQILNISYFRIILYKNGIIKMKGTKKTIRIDDNS